MTPERRAFLIGAVAGLVIGGAWLIGKAWGQTSGEMVRCNTFIVTDGDSGTCVTDTARIKIRLWGIDAPDFACKGRPHCREDKPRAEAAKRFLGALAGSGDVFCRLRTLDRYRRSVAVCYAQGQDIGCTLIRAGHAVEWHRYSRGAYRECAARP